MNLSLHGLWDGAGELLPVLVWTSTMVMGVLLGGAVFRCRWRWLGVIGKVLLLGCLSLSLVEAIQVLKFGVAWQGLHTGAGDNLGEVYVPMADYVLSVAIVSVTALAAIGGTRLGQYLCRRDDVRGAGGTK